MAYKKKTTKKKVTKQVVTKQMKANYLASILAKKGYDRWDAADYIERSGFTATQAKKATGLR